MDIQSEELEPAAPAVDMSLSGKAPETVNLLTSFSDEEQTKAFVQKAIAGIKATNKR